jgi:hypothetical protein
VPKQVAQLADRSAHRPKNLRFVDTRQPERQFRVETNKRT